MCQARSVQVEKFVLLAAMMEINIDELRNYDWKLIPSVPE
jgi:hypothetical protein